MKRLSDDGKYFETLDHGKHEPGTAGTSPAHPPALSAQAHIIKSEKPYAGPSKSKEDNHKFRINKRLLGALLY